MPPIALKCKKVNEIKDKLFLVDQIQNYALSVIFGDYDSQISVLDIATGRLVFCEDYVFSRRCRADEQLVLLKQLFDAHPFLGAGFWQRVNFVVKNEKFVQAPTALFEKDVAVQYLTLNATVDKDRERVLYCRSKCCDLFTIFAISNELVSWIENKYSRSKVAFSHQAASLIEGVYAESSQRADMPLYLYVDRFRLHILFMRQGKLIYYNQFIIREFADYIKYIMLVIQMMKMSAKTARVILWGCVGKKSPHLTAFSKYLRNVSLGGRPDHVKFGHVFDEIEDHQFFDLYSIHRLFH